MHRRAQAGSSLSADRAHPAVQVRVYSAGGGGTRVPRFGGFPRGWPPRLAGSVVEENGSKRIARISRIAPRQFNAPPGRATWSLEPSLLGIEHGEPGEHGGGLWPFSVFSVVSVLNAEPRI